MKHIKIMTTAVLLAYSFQAAAEIKLLNGIAAEVNGSIITYSDIERGVRLLRTKPESQGISNADLSTIVKNQLIERATILDAAKQQNFKVTPAEINAESQRIASLQNTTLEGLNDYYSNLGWGKDEYRREIAKNLLVQKITARTMESVEVSDSDIQNYIDEAKKNGKVIPSGSPFTVYKVQRIVLKIKENHTDSAVGERIKQIARSIENGSDFGTLAKRYSQEAAAAQNGITEISQNTEPPKVDAMLQILQPQQTSAPIQTSQDWQIIKMISKRTEIDPDKTQRQAIYNILKQQKQQEAYTKFWQQLSQDLFVQNY